jgi:hypothetical protein
MPTKKRSVEDLETKTDRRSSKRTKMVVHGKSVFALKQAISKKKS